MPRLSYIKTWKQLYETAFVELNSTTFQEITFVKLNSTTFYETAFANLKFDNTSQSNLRRINLKKFYEASSTISHKKTLGIGKRWSESWKVNCAYQTLHGLTVLSLLPHLPWPFTKALTPNESSWLTMAIPKTLIGFRWDTSLFLSTEQKPRDRLQPKRGHE